MGDKQYIPPPLESDPHPYFPHLIANGAFSPSGTFNDVYMGPLFSQNTNNQRTPSKVQDNMFQYQDVVNWENIKIPEKIDLIEITSKDLSPASYCSNIDLLIPDSGTHFNKYDQNWYGTNQNFGFSQQKTEFPPCAQMNKFTTETTQFCAIQKRSENIQNLKSCAYYNSENNFTNNSYAANYSNFCNKSYTEDPNFYPALNYAPIIPPIDQQTELSNDESDIVVEDSEDEQTDFSEEQEKNSNFQSNQCLICNTNYTPMGVQFYFLTSQNPLTMSTQVPVINKILKIVGNVHSDKNFLCSNCLGLVNSIDHLQQKLDAFTKDLIQKFKNSCLENKIRYKERKEPKFRRYRCKKCRKIMCLQALCQNHIKRHTSRGFLCELCGKFFKSFKKLRYHLKLHINKKVSFIPSFRCSNSNCDKIFRTKSNLKEHENFCLGTLPFKCKKCFKKFPSSTKLKNHVKLKHDKKFVAICSICNIGFTKIFDYKSHMISHSTDKKFQCKKCEKSYKTLSNLNFHMKMHQNKLPFQCQICHKGFMRKEYLETHVNNHKNIKNFSCTSCDKKFASQKNLDAHLKNHDSSKKNTCNICHKIISSDFEEHLRVHSNLREFECDICEMRFNTKNTLAKHKKRKHSEI